MTNDIAEERDFTQLGQTEEDVDKRIELNPILAYGLLNGSKTSNPLSGTGIRTIVKTGTGTYTVVFPQALTNSTYTVVVTPDQERVVWVHTKTKGQFKITTENNSSAAADTNRLNVVVLR